MDRFDAIRTILKFLPASRSFALGFGAGLLALLFFVRAAENADGWGQTGDEVAGALVGLVALWQLSKGAWSVLVIKEQERVLQGHRDVRPPPRGGIMDPDDAVRRASGRFRQN
jgi:hypothetical protein